MKIHLSDIETALTIDDILPIRVTKVFDPEGNPIHDKYLIYVKNISKNRWEVFGPLTSKFSFWNLKQLSEKIINLANIQTRPLVKYDAGVVLVAYEKEKIQEPNKFQLLSYAKEIFGTDVTDVDISLCYTFMQGYNGAVGGRFGYHLKYELVFKGDKKNLVTFSSTPVKHTPIKLTEDELDKFINLPYELLIDKFKSVTYDSVRVQLIDVFSTRIIKKVDKANDHRMDLWFASILAYLVGGTTVQNIMHFDQELTKVISRLR